MKIRATKSLEWEIPVMTLLWNIYRIIVIYSVNLEKNIMMENVRRNVTTPVPGYLNRQIRTTWTLTCAKTPVRALANIARPAPMRNILGVSGTVWRCVTTLTSGVTDILSVMEQLMNLWRVLPAV